MKISRKIVIGAAVVLVGGAFVFGVDLALSRYTSLRPLAFLQDTFHNLRGAGGSQSKMEDFIKKVMLGGDTTQKLELKNFQKNSGLYHADVYLNGQQVGQSSMSADGKYFFPSRLEVAAALVEAKKQAEVKAREEAEAKKPLPKTARPEVEVFVMSHCPFGTQIEKGILPVVRKLDGQANIQIKYVDYAMHGQQEIDEQLRQHCIWKQSPQKFWDYLECFLGEGKSEECLGETKIAAEALQKCVKQTDEEFGISRDFENKDTWRGNFPSFALHKEANQKYNIAGSPALVINGKKIPRAPRDAQGLFEKICSAFETAPAICDEKLSDPAPQPGFGWDEKSGGAGRGGSCG